MTYEIVRTKQFRKDVKQMIRRGKDDHTLERILRLLANGDKLPSSNRDHALTGNYIGFRECHIEPDWLLIYMLYTEPARPCLLSYRHTQRSVR